MSLSLEFTNKIKSLDLLLEEYSAWFQDVCRAVHYPTEMQDTKVQIRAEAFDSWVREMEHARLSEAGALTDLQVLLDDLIRYAARLVHEAHLKEKPPLFEEFDTLLTYFEEFMLRARRFQQESLMQESGVDPVTGLRTPHFLERDIHRELDRLERQGKAFALALIKINQFERFMELLPPREAQDALLRVVELIRRNLRSYDDAYYLGAGEFALSLKQTTQAGAVRALARMKNELEDMNSVHNLDGIRTVLSLSSCVAEPVPENNVSELITGLRQQLGKPIANETVVQYEEMSALQKFLQQGKT
jgi:diguanylate cyclase (GGDEF)-like protein